MASFSYRLFFQADGSIKNTLGGNDKHPLTFRYFSCSQGASSYRSVIITGPEAVALFASEGF